MGEHGRVEDIEPPVLYVGNTVVSRAGGREGGREGELQRNGGLTLFFSVFSHITHRQTGNGNGAHCRLAPR